MTAANLGKSLDRWRQISTCMIEKIVGVPRIDKLRVIHLFEADLNMLLKIMWARKCVWQMNDLSINNVRRWIHSGFGKKFWWQYQAVVQLAV
jgi:hypothetical protein